MNAIFTIGVIGSLLLGGPKSPLEKVRTQRLKEPSYTAKPYYGCLAIDQGKKAVWFAIDGEKLYLDANMNGDLTDDGEPTASKQLDYFKTPHIFFEVKSMGISMLFGAEKDGKRTAIDVRWTYEGLYWGTRSKTYPSVTQSRATTMVINIVSPLSFCFDTINGTDGKLTRDKKTTFYAQLCSAGSGVGASMSRSCTDVPKEAYAVAKFKFESADGKGPIFYTAELKSRC